MRTTTVALSLLVSLITGNAQALEPIHSLRIFQTQETFVLDDVSLPPGLPVEVYELDASQRATEELNRQVRSRLQEDLNLQTYEDAHRRAFSDLLNSPDWGGVYQQIEVGSRAIQAAVRLQIKKIPAVVFNDQKVVYGQRSLKAALEVYNKEGRR